jgi:hypothetical protein
MTSGDEIARRMEEDRTVFHQRAKEFKAAAERARAVGETKLADHLDGLAKTFADT